jgi:folate-binding protein YgfZ
LIGPEASIIKFLQDHDIPEVAFDAYDQRRIARGVPDGTRDLEVEKSILLESNIDELHGIDWEKGCYMGQELTARTKYRGLVKRRLHAFETTVNAAEPGDPILSGDKEVGNVRSTNGNLLLASIRTDALESEKPELSLKDSPLKRIMETD